MPGTEVLISIFIGWPSMLASIPFFLAGLVARRHLPWLLVALTLALLGAWGITL